MSAREFVGVVRARHETDLGFRVAGKIVTRIVNVGDRVRAGDVVARLDPQDLQLQAESAEAELAAATSNLAQAAADLERYATLRERGYASIADFDRKKPAKDEAEGRARARASARSISRATSSPMPNSRPTPMASSRRRSAEPGQVVAVGQPVARLAHRGEKEAVVALPETWLGEAAQGRGDRAAVVRPRAQLRRARCASFRRRPTPASRTYAARFTIDGRRRRGRASA